MSVVLMTGCMSVVWEDRRTEVGGNNQGAGLSPAGSRGAYPKICNAGDL
jgi:hypothetical protein